MPILHGIDYKEFAVLMEKYTPKMQLQTTSDVTEILYEFWETKNVGAVSDDHSSTFRHIQSIPKIRAIIREVAGAGAVSNYSVHYMHEETRGILDQMKDFDKT